MEVQVNHTILRSPDCNKYGTQVPRDTWLDAFIIHYVVIGLLTMAP
jgi:hypothetical protein